MVRSQVPLLISALALVGAVPGWAGPTAHAMELTNDGVLFFVDLDRQRLLKLSGSELSVHSTLEGVPEGDPMQNLVLTVSGELYVGAKKLVFRIDDDGSIESAKPPGSIKALFSNRPADLAPDGSVYVASDYRSIDRSLPGGDSHPVLLTDTISKIHTLSVTPYGRVFFGNSSEVAKINARGEVDILVDLQGQTVLGLAAESENSVLLLRRDRDGRQHLERIDAFGNSATLLTDDQIAAVAVGAPIRIEYSE